MAPTATSTGTSSRGQASRPRGSGKPAKGPKETKAERQMQKSCEKQGANLLADKQRQALAQCLNPTPPAPEVPETPVQC